MNIKLALSSNQDKINEYIIDKAYFENDIFSLSTTIIDNRFKVILTPKCELSDLSIIMKIDIEPIADMRFYSNGYQSWSLSREYAATDKYSGVNKLLAPTVKAAGGYLVGDYSFVEYPSKKGVFNSTSHCYLRSKDSAIINLYGSANERSGYTYFTADLGANALYVTKDLQGLTITEPYELLDFVNICGEYNEVFDKYFAVIGIKPRTNTKLKGYTSWYNYYRDINEQIILRDLEALTSSGNENINVFQIDDGYQPCIGDLTAIDTAKFPNGLKPIVDAIHDKNLLAGLWLCPFGVTKKSETYIKHFDWVLKDDKNKPIKVGAAWGGFYCLDFYNDDVRDYIRASIHTMLDDWGFDMVKMDFLYCVCTAPRYNKTRATIMYEAMEFLRDCVGDKLILGCGVPLAPAFGIVDYCRIGTDVSLKYAPTLDYAISREMLSARKTLLNTLFRRYLDGRAFLNDPDVFILRDSNTALSKEEKLLLATINKLGGSVLFCSDNVADYDKRAKDIFNFVMDNSTIKVNDITINGKNTLTIKYSIDSLERILSYNFMTAEIYLDQKA